MAASCGASSVPVRVSSAGTFWPGWRPWSLRKRRTSVTTCWTSSISFSAASSRKPESPGHSAMTIDSRPVSAVHSASVTNGTIGCGGRSITSRTSPRTRPETSAGRPPAKNVVLDSSTYQSKTSSHAKWRSDSLILANWKSS
ncbi:hypothetical protein SFIMM107S_05901 [Streptomyces griseus]